MAYYPEPFARLIEALERLPGIGPKSAQRMTFYLLKRPIDEVKSRKIMLGSLLDQARQGAIVDGELSIVLTGSRFQRETLNERANRDLILQAIRKYMPGVERISVAEGDGGTGGDIRSHPAVEAAIAEFDGEVVIVRPRQAEGESQ